MTKFNAAFWRWFGNSKVVDAKGRPRVMYHGSPSRGIRVFKKGDITGLIWTTASKNYAKGYSVQSGGKGEVYSLYVRAEKPFDVKADPTNARYLAEDFYQSYEGQAGVFSDTSYWLPRLVSDYISMFKGKVVLAEDVTEAQIDSYDLGAFVKHVLSGSWVVLEIPELVSMVNNAGYDGWVSYEGGHYNIAVFSPTQIKSATGNLGTWSRTDPDIRRNPKLRFALEENRYRRGVFEGKAYDGRRLVGYIRLKVQGLSAHVEWAKSLDESRRGTATALLKHMLGKLRVVRRLLVIPVTEAGARFAAKLVAQQKRMGLDVSWGLPEAHGMDWRGTGVTATKSPRRRLAKLIGTAPQKFKT
jgi:hypothetical protein